MKLLSKKIDFLTLRLTENTPIFQKLVSLVENADSWACGDSPFVFRSLGVMESGQRKWLMLYDSENNPVATVRLRLGNSQKVNRNFPSDVQFNGTFWNYYSEHFWRIVDYLMIPLDSPSRVLRMDFKFDFFGATPSYFAWKVPNCGTFKKDKTVIIDRRLTWWRRKTDRMEFCFYDKKLDIRERKTFLFRFQDGADVSNHYKDYLKLPGDVTRVECRWNSVYFKNKPSSINWVVSNSEKMTRDALKYLFKDDISVFGKLEVGLASFAVLLFSVPYEAPISDLLSSEAMARNMRTFEWYYKRLYGELGDSEFKKYLYKVTQSVCP